MDDSKKISDHIENIIKELNKNTLNFNQLFQLTLESIEFIENEYQNLNGIQKKELLIETLKDICEYSNLLELGNQVFLRKFIDGDLSTIIDSIIQISNGEFHINEQQQMLLIKYLTKLCKFLFKKCMKQKKQTRGNIVNNP